MVEISATVSRESMADLSAMIRRLQEDTGRSASDALTYAAVRVSLSGGAASKIGRKKRPSVDNPLWAQAKWAIGRRRRGHRLSAQDEQLLNSGKPLSPFLIVAYRQSDTKPFLMPSYDKQDPRREIERRGIAKKTWKIMAAKSAAMKGRDSATDRGENYRVSKYQERFGSDPQQVVRLVNRLTYLEKAYPGITQTAVAKGASALRQEMDRKASAAAARANRGGR